MRRDAIFYQLFKQFPDSLFELVGELNIEARGYRFESVEVKEPTFRIDGVFLPPEGAAPKVVVFAEVQFQKDPALYDRFFAESFLYLYRNRIYDDWHGVVIFPSRSLEPENAAIHRSLLGGPQVQRIYLDELGEPDRQPIRVSVMQLAIASEQEMVAQAKRLIERAREEESNTDFKKTIIESAAMIVVYKFSNLGRDEVWRMLGIDMTETKVYQEAKAEGQAEGRLEERRSLFVSILTNRFGAIDEELSSMIDSMIDLPADVLAEIIVAMSTLSREQLLEQFSKDTH